MQTMQTIIIQALVPTGKAFEDQELSVFRIIYDLDKILMSYV